MAKSKNRTATNTVVIPEETANDLVEEIGDDAANELEEITGTIDAVDGVDEDGDDIQEVDGDDGLDQPEDVLPELPETPEEIPEVAPAQTLEVLQNERRDLALKLSSSWNEDGEPFTQEDEERMAILSTAIASYKSGNEETAKKISNNANTIGGEAMAAASMEVFNTWVNGWTVTDDSGNITSDIGDTLASFNERSAMLAWAHLDEDGNQTFGKDGDGKSLQDGDLLVQGKPAGDGLGDFHVAWSAKTGETLEDQIQAHLAEIALKQFLHEQLVLGHSLLTGTLTGKVVLEGERRRVSNYLYAALATFKKTGTGKVTSGTGDGATASTEYQTMKKNGQGTLSIMDGFTVNLVTGGQLDFPQCAVEDIQYLCERWKESDGNGRPAKGKATVENCERFGGAIGKVCEQMKCGYYHDKGNGWTNLAGATTGTKWLVMLEKAIRSAAVDGDGFKFAQNLMIGGNDGVPAKRLIDLEMFAKIKAAVPSETVEDVAPDLEDGGEDGGKDV